MREINFTEGVKRYSGEEAYLNLLRSYRLHTPAILEKMRTLGSPTEGGGGISLPQYTILVHGLKGSSYSISASAVGKEAEELEAAARSGDIEKTITMNLPFIEKAEALLNDLDKVLQKAASHKAPLKEARAPDTKLLSRLLEATNEYKAAEMEEIIRELESFRYDSGSKLITWLREQMDKLEYDAIREWLEVNNEE